MIRILIWSLVALIFAIGTWTRFTNTQLTETQLLLEFWPRWLLVCMIAIVVVVLNRRGTNAS